jgi:hypothetical protein
MHKTALQARVNDFLRHLHCGINIRVSKQAVSKRRNSFDHTPFLKMQQELVETEYTYFETTRWNGYVVLGVDGSTLQLPREDSLREEFKTGSSGNCPLAGMTVLYDTLHGWPINSIITHSHMNEREECIKHIDFLCEALPHIAKKSILTLDRGYPSYELFSHLQEKDLIFVARCSSSSFNEVNNAPLGDRIVKLKNGMELRVIKKELPSGNVIAIATNLFEFEMDEIIFLYKLRWEIETMYKVLKENLYIEGFSGKTTNTILQDFYVSMVNLIGVAIMQNEGNKIAKELRKHKTQNMYEYEVNTSNLVTTIRNRYLILILFRPDGVCIERDLYDILYKIADCVMPIRKNRQFPRRFRDHYKANHNLKVR